MKEEEKLVQKSQEGESEAFGELYDMYMPKIYRFIFLKVSGKSDAEDLSHQVFLSAWKNIKTFKYQGYPFSSWLYKIANNAVIDFYRTKKDAIDIESIAESAVYEKIETPNVLDDAFEMERVQIALKKLKPDDQSVLIMKFVNELSNKEIAKTLGKTEGAVRVMQHRAIKQLQQYLKDGK